MRNGTAALGNRAARSIPVWHRAVWDTSCWATLRPFAVFLPRQSCLMTARLKVSVCLQTVCMPMEQSWASRFFIRNTTAMRSTRFSPKGKWKRCVPDMEAGCSLADSCPADQFAQFVKEHPGHTVISYVNTTAAVKAVTDVVVTSTNARQIVESFPKDEKIIFGPDRNLGNYINSVTNRNMLLWDGACHVHEQFSVEKIVELKTQHPEALVLAHPECKSTVLKLADVVGSTAALLKYAVNHPENTYIVATESGILHEMQKKCPQTTFIPAPPNDSTCGCNECSFMRLNTLEKLYECLKNESPEITVDPEIAEKAVRPIQRMLEISAKLGL